MNEAFAIQNTGHGQMFVTFLLPILIVVTGGLVCFYRERRGDRMLLGLIVLLGGLSAFCAGWWFVMHKRDQNIIQMARVVDQIEYAKIAKNSKAVDSLHAVFKVLELEGRE